jgi:hypothetical protein
MMPNFEKSSGAVTERYLKELRFLKTSTNENSSGFLLLEEKKKLKRVKRLRNDLCSTTEMVA